LYVENKSFFLDIYLIILTLLSIISREKTLLGVSNLLKHIDASADIINISKRKNELVPFPPPGSDNVVMSR